MKDTDRPLKKIMFDWRNPKITNWRKLLRIKLLHGFTDIDCRGLSAQEIGIDMLKKHRDKLTKEELQFVESLFK
jgi:hypothetical protein